MIAIVITLRVIAALTMLCLCASPVGTQTEVEKPPAVENPTETTPAPSKVRGEVGSAWARP